jgi:Cdc6-like AAA superfamily ATPase
MIHEVHDTVSKTSADVAQIKSMVDGDEGLKILNWLTPIDYGSQQSDFIKRRYEGTGAWLLYTKEFNTWLNERNQTLLCSGIPGAGKTILTSIVVDHLFSKFRTDLDVGIAYLYCNFRQQQQQRLEDLLSSILKQWLQKQTSVPQNIKKLYEMHKRITTRPSLDEILEALNSVASLYSRVIIIVDALDECDNSGGNRQKFLSLIRDLQRKTKANLFATSRINTEIAKSLDPSLSLDIRANEHDVKSYIDGQLLLLQSDIVDDDLRDSIRKDVVASVDGMYANPSIKDSKSFLILVPGSSSRSCT